MRRILLLCLTGWVVFVGCSEGSFLQRNYDNFTAYYNTFYNAEQAFQEGEKALERANQAINQSRYMELFTGTEATQGANFEEVIKKSADVIRAHPRSKWVDNAVLLIGKSYFYQQNYAAAEGRLRFLIDQGGEHEDEARFWTARTLIATEQFEEAISLLEESLNREDIQDKWKPALQLALGDLYVKRRDWAAAAQALSAGVAEVNDRDLGARAQFLLGQVFETQSDYPAAIEAFADVRKFRPLYTLEYAARFNEVRLQGFHGDGEKALDEVEKMIFDGKNIEHFADLQLLKARILQAQGYSDDALTLYRDVLYDPDVNIGTAAGAAHYRLGELLRDHYSDYIYASAHFDTAATNLRPPENPRDLFTPSAINDAQDQARIFKDFSTAMYQVMDMDSLLYLGSLDSTAFDSVVAQIQQRLAEEERLRREEEARREAEMAFQQAVSETNTAANRNNPNRATRAAQGGSEFGFLYYRNAARVQEAATKFAQDWGNRPLAPNWRRSAAIVGTQATETEEDTPSAGEAEAAVFEEGEILPVVDVSAVPRDSISQAEMRAQRALARYAVGNALFLSIGRPDSAAVWYRRVVEEDAGEPVAERAFYALGEVQWALGDSLSARRIFEQVRAQYPDTDFADRAAERLGLPVTRQEAPDSTALAQTAYEATYTAWQESATQTVVLDMLQVAFSYPKTPAAPRALLASTLIYEQILQENNGDLYAPLPDTLVRLVEHYHPPEPPPTLDPPTEIPTDSTTVADSLQAPNLPVDSLQTPVLPDSTQVMATDSLGVQSTLPDSLQTEVAPPDSLMTPDPPVAEPPVDQEPAEPPPFLLDRLYTLISELYPSTPYAMRAATLKQYWTMHQPQPAAPEPPAQEAPAPAANPTPQDSTQVAQPVPDSLQMPANPAADPARIRQIADSLQQNDPKRNQLREIIEQRTRQAADSTRTPPDTLRIKSTPPDTSRGR